MLLGAYGGLRFSEIAGLRRKRLDVLRAVSRPRDVVGCERGASLGPARRSSRREVPLPRSIWASSRPTSAATWPRARSLWHSPAPRGRPPRRARFGAAAGNQPSRPRGWTGSIFASEAHLRIPVSRCRGRCPRDIVPGHSSVSFSLDRYGHLYQDRSDALAERLDHLRAKEKGR